jgi:hypothetical protein
MAYGDVLYPILKKWSNNVTRYDPSIGYDPQKYKSAQVVYEVINSIPPEEAFRILKNLRDETEQLPKSQRYIDANLIDEGVEDAKKLMNYHGKFRKVSTKKRAYIDDNDREEKFRQSLMKMTEEKLFVECKRYIKLSTYAMNNPGSVYHTRVMDCYNECERRGIPKLYHSAYSEVHSELFGKGRKTVNKRPKRNHAKSKKKR